MSAAAGHAIPPDHRAGPIPFPLPSSPRGTACAPSSTALCCYESLHGRSSPLFHPVLLPPWQGCVQRPSSAPLPPVHPGQPERRRLPQDYHCHHHSPTPLLVKANLETLPAKWPCPSPSSILPRAIGSHRCRPRSLERLFVVKTLPCQTASPPNYMVALHQYTS
jgi:hypothetical protein